MKRQDLSRQLDEKHDLLCSSAQPSTKVSDQGYGNEIFMADINDKLVGFYETGKRIPPVINLVAIAEALDVSVDELCGVNTLEPSTELEQEIMRAVRGVLREYRVEKK